VVTEHLEAAGETVYALGRVTAGGSGVRYQESG